RNGRQARRIPTSSAATRCADTSRLRTNARKRRSRRCLDDLRHARSPRSRNVMRSSYVAMLASLGASLAVASAGAQQKYPTPKAGAACARNCLVKVLDSYLAALVAHDATKVPVAANARLVENITPIKPGQRLSQSDSADALHVTA